VLRSDRRLGVGFHLRPGCRGRGPAFDRLRASGVGGTRL